MGSPVLINALLLIIVILIVKRSLLRYCFFFYITDSHLTQKYVYIIANTLSYIYFNITQMSLSELEQQNKFKKHLSQYWASKGITQIKIPQIGGQELNLYKLYKTVCKKGGGQAVSHNKLWKEIVDQFGLPSTCTSASFTLKNHYQKYLLGYQQRFFFGKDDSADLPELVAGRQRKPIIKGQGYSTLGLQPRFGQRMEGESMHSSLAAQLKKYYEKADHNSSVNYIKRTKLYPVMSEVKHLIMGFQSNLREEIIYAINTLLLFSVNTQAPFLFNQYPFVLESIHSYIIKNFPPKDIFTLQCLRTITAALRNLLLNHKNMQAVLESDLVEALFSLFEDQSDRQLARNITDIFSSLTRIGLDCRQLFVMIQQFLERQTYQDIETGIDLLRALVEQKEDSCEQVVANKIEYFARLLVYSSQEIRESILEIFAYLSDKSERIKRLCLGSFRFVDRLFASISHGFGVNQKQAQLACFILNNIAQLGQPAFTVFKRYQRVLALVSFNDQALSPITSSLLYVLSGRGGEAGENAAVANMRLNIRNEMEEENSESSMSGDSDD